MGDAFAFPRYAPDDGKVKRFPRGAWMCSPHVDEDDICPTPIGVECLRCRVPIERGDVGVTQLLVREGWERCAFHRACLLDGIVGEAHPKEIERVRKQDEDYKRMVTSPHYRGEDE